MGLKIEKAVALANAYPNSGNAPLAAILYRDNPGLFKDKEDARDAIRRARGSAGSRNRKKYKTIADKQQTFPNGRNNPYDLPEEKHHDNKFYKINVNSDTIIGLLSDIHFPYQNNEALTTALDYCKQQKITHLLLNGDIMDCYQISSFDRDPKADGIKYEIDLTRAFLATIQEKFKGVKIIFKGGNHEQRLIRYLRRKAPELLGLEVLSLDSLLGLRERSIDYVPDNKLIEAGNLLIIHGHEFGHQIFSPVNPARGYFLKSKTNVIGGHNHQVSSHSENRLDGKQIVAYSTGHLADPHPEYKPVNNWSHGFAVIKFVKNSGRLDFVVSNKKIINGIVY